MGFQVSPAISTKTSATTGAGKIPILKHQPGYQGR